MESRWRVISTNFYNLEEAVVRLLERRGLTLAAAESCTGGLFAKRLTDMPGASQVFLGGVVAYSLHAKTALLGVDTGLIDEKGSVSREVAAAMADGVREKIKADIGIGITGIAGPDGDGSGLNPGTVFVALSTSRHSLCEDLKLQGDRGQIREASASHAFDMIQRFLNEK